LFGNKRFNHFWRNATVWKKKNQKKDAIKKLAMYSHESTQAFKNLEILSHDPKTRALYEAKIMVA